MPTREQVRGLLDGGLDYEGAGRRLGIPPGQAYLIATGVAADGSDTITDADAQRPGYLRSSQHLANPPHENPTVKESVAAWLKARAAADEQMRTALRARTAEPPEQEETSRDAITVLGRQHGQVRYLLKQLQALPSHTAGGSPEQMSARKSTVDVLTARLSAHQTIEEEHFWPAVREALPDGDRYADKALEQEQQGKDTLTELGRLDPGTREFDELLGRLAAQLRKHVAFQDMVFLKAREAIPQDGLDRLGEKLLSAMKTAPARPRKHAPQRSGAAVKAAAKGKPRKQSQGERGNTSNGRTSNGGAA